MQTPILECHSSMTPLSHLSQHVEWQALLWPCPAATISCYWSHLILGNTSCLSQCVEKFSWATFSFHILQSIMSYCSNKAISAYVCSVIRFSSILEVSSFVKYEQDLPISFAYLFPRLLSFQSSIASNFCLCLLGCLVCN